MAGYTRQELTRLQLGYILREQSGQSEQTDNSTRVARQKRKVREGHQQARREMYADLGFQ